MGFSFFPFYHLTGLPSPLFAVEVEKKILKKIKHTNSKLSLILISFFSESPQASQDSCKYTMAIFQHEFGQLPNLAS